MDQPSTHQPRTKFLLALPGCLLVGLLPIVIFKFFVSRSIGKFFRHLTGQEAADPHVKASVAKAKKRVRKATAGFNFARHRYARAEAKLVKAQAALEAAQGKPVRASQTDAETSAPERWWKSRKGRFVIGSGKLLARYLFNQKPK